MFSQNQNVFNVLFEAISEGVIVVNKDQKIVATNASLQQIFGYKKDELLDQHLNILIPKNYHSGHGAHFTGFLNHNESRQMGKGRDIFGAKKDGTIFPIEAGLNPFTIDDENYVMALVIDITIRKQQELQIKELNADLEAKVEERSKELYNTVEKLKTVNEELHSENQRRLAAEKKIKSALKKEK